MTFHSGRTGTATNSGNELPVISWRVNPTVGIVDFKNSKTGRFPYRESTFFDCAGTIVIDYDFDASPFVAPQSIAVGNVLANVKLYINASTAGPYWNFPSVIVATTPMEVVIDGRIGTSFDFVINGPFQYPSGYTPGT